MRLIVICCGMIVKRTGMLGERARNMKALPVKMETVTLIVKGKWNLTCLYIKFTKLIVKCCFFADVLFLGRSF